MKIKAEKKAKSADVKLHKLKKSKNDIAKPKEKKTGGPMAAAVTPHTFAEKKVLAVKKKNQKQQLVESVKTAKVQASAGILQKKKDLKAKKQKEVAKKVVDAEQKDASSEKTKRKRKWKKKVGF